MKLACLFGRHQARASAVRNQGLYFSHCLHCGRDMVRTLGRWRPVPRGFRVVWRSAGAPDPIAANLPVSSRARARPASEFGSRLTALAAMARAGISAMCWALGDRMDMLRRRVSLRRRPALPRLPAR
jgi:hypothetical protein